MTSLSSPSLRLPPEPVTVHVDPTTGLAMTSLQSSSSPLLSSSSALPPARPRRDSVFSLTQPSPMLSSYLLTTPTLTASSPALLAYPSPFYSSASIFQPLQSPFMSPMPSHPPMLDISTPTQLSLTPSTSLVASAPAADMQLPPSALASSSAAASLSSSSTAEQSATTSSSSRSSHSLLYASSSFPFNSHQAAILTHHEDAMLAAADDDEDDDDDDDCEESIMGGGGRRKKKSISLLSHNVDTEAARSPLHSSALELMEETPSTPNSRPSSPSYYSSTESEASREEDTKRVVQHRSRAGRLSKPSARTKRQSSPARTPRAKKEKLSSHISSTASTASEQSDAPSTPTSITSHSSSAAPTVMTAAEMAKEQTGGSGLSCHQCKTRKQLDELYTCGNYERKKRATGEDKKNIKPCRKKYCARCLHKFYNEQPPARRENGTTVLEFECPSCRLICQCAACRKRQQLAETANGAGGKQQETEEVEKADGGQLEDEVEAAESTLDSESDMMLEDSTCDEEMGDGSAAGTTLTVSDVVEPSLDDHKATVCEV